MVLCQIFVGVIVLPLLIVSLLFMILLLFVSLPTLLTFLVLKCVL